MLMITLPDALGALKYLGVQRHLSNDCDGTNSNQAIKRVFRVLSYMLVNEIDPSGKKT